MLLSLYLLLPLWAALNGYVVRPWWTEGAPDLREPRTRHLTRLPAGRITWFRPRMSGVLDGQAAPGPARPTPPGSG
jgi:hypothetical protein